MKRNLFLVFVILSLLLSSSMVLATDIPASASVSKYISVTFSYSSLNFGSVTSPSTDNEPTNLNQTEGQLNVSTDTNYDYTVKIRGTDFSGPETIAITNMEFVVNNTLQSVVDKVNPLSLTTSDQTAFSKTVTTAGVQATEYNGYWLDIPSSKLAGSYSSTITLTHANA